MNSSYERTPKQTQFARAYQQIDHLVYELYGLTPEEIKIVENAGGDAASLPDADETKIVEEGTS